MVCVNWKGNSATANAFSSTCIERDTSLSISHVQDTYIIAYPIKLLRCVSEYMPTVSSASKYNINVLHYPIQELRNSNLSRLAGLFMGRQAIQPLRWQDMSAKFPGYHSET